MYQIVIMNKQSELNEEIKNMLIELTDKESVISFLRLNNYSKPQSIEIFRSTLGISYYEAQDIIHNSQIWSDVKESDDKIIDDFFDILEELESLDIELDS
jgi:endonuclease V-like protein UPF0215 family